MEVALTTAPSNPDALCNPAGGRTSDEMSVQVASTQSSDYVLMDLFLETLVAWKTIYHIRQLQTLGFEAWQSAEAVKRYGSNLECAITWLLDGDEDSTNSTTWRLNATIPEVDISPELSYIKDVQEVLSLPEHVIQQAVIDCDGDLDSAIMVVMEGKGSHSEVAPENNAQLLSDNPQQGADLPFSFDYGSTQLADKDTPSDQIEPHPNMKHKTVVAQSEWPETLSDQLMLGGVLGSKLEEYMSGNADFTSLANKGIGGHSDQKVHGFGRSIQGNVSTGVELLHPNQVLYRNMVQSASGADALGSDIGQYNRILGADLSARNNMHCVGYGSSLAGAPSSWDSRIPPGYAGLPIHGDMIQDEQQDWRHLIGNLLES